MTPYPRHFHVVFDVASCLLNPSNNARWLTCQKRSCASRKWVRIKKHFFTLDNCYAKVAVAFKATATPQRIKETSLSQRDVFTNVTKRKRFSKFYYN